MASNARRRRLLAIATGLAAAVVVAEVGLRLTCMTDGMFFGRRPLPPFGATTNPRQDAWVAAWRQRLAAGHATTETGSYDAELGVTMSANTRAGDDSYGTNSVGARGSREYPTSPPEDTLRILTFGDSFTFCSEVLDRETWQSALEQSTTNVEALNFGVGSYGTDQAWLRYQRRRADLPHHHVVTIGLMLENIARNVNRYRPIYYPSTPVVFAKPRFVLAKDHGSDPADLRLLPLPYPDFASFLDHVADGTVVGDLSEHEYWTATAPLGDASVLLRLVSGFFAYRARDHRRLWQRPTDEPFRVTLAVLRAFHADARAHGAAIAPVLIFPAEADLAATLDEGSRYWTPLCEALSRAGVPYLDLSVPLEALCRSTNRPSAALFVGGHLGPEANTRVAAHILEWLERSLAEPTRTGARDGTKIPVPTRRS